MQQRSHGVQHINQTILPTMLYFLHNVFYIITSAAGNCLRPNFTESI